MAADEQAAQCHALADSQVSGNDNANQQTRANIRVWQLDCPEASEEKRVASDFADDYTADGEEQTKTQKEGAVYEIDIDVQCARDRSLHDLGLLRGADREKTNPDREAN